MALNAITAAGITNAFVFLTSIFFPPPLYLLSQRDMLYSVNKHYLNLSWKNAKMTKRI